MNHERDPFNVNDLTVNSNIKTVGHTIPNAAIIRKERVRRVFEAPIQPQNLGTINGVTYINDSRATNLNLTWYSLEIIKCNIVLILGGQHTYCDYSIISNLVIDKVRVIVAMGKSNRNIENFFQ